MRFPALSRNSAGGIKIWDNIWEVTVDSDGNKVAPSAINMKNNYL